MPHSIGGRAPKCTRPSILVLVYSDCPAGARSAAGPGGGSEGDGSGAWSGRGAPAGGPRSEKAGRTSSLFAEVPPGDLYVNGTDAMLTQGSDVPPCDDPDISCYYGVRNISYNLNICPAPFLSGGCAPLPSDVTEDFPVIQYLTGEVLLSTNSELRNQPRLIT